MNNRRSFLHSQCRYYITNYDVGFRLISPRKGETYAGKKFKFHSIVFVLEGELRFSYDDFLNRELKKGDLFFAPQASAMYGEALKDSHMLVLTFNSHIDSLCDACTLTNYAKVPQETEPDFIALPMHEVIWGFSQQMEQYIRMNIRCAFLHKLKQKELFVLLQHCYSQEQIVSLFYPAIGMIDFKSWVLENYTPETSLKDLARKYNLNHKSFSRKFSQEFGLSFRKWTLKQKAKHIMLRLSMPDTTFSDIVRDFNFADQHCFYAFCKEQYGCTATELQKRIRG